VGRDALWLALADTRTPVRDQPLLRLDLASGTVERPLLVGGQASDLTRVGDVLFASVAHDGSRGSGPSLVVALDWSSGRVLARRLFPAAVGPLVEGGTDLWALELRPAVLLRLDPLTLAPKGPPLRLSQGRALGLAVGDGHVWVTAPDAGEVLRVDPAAFAVAHVRVGGFPIGIAFASGSVWFVDRDRARVGRLNPRTLKAVGEPIGVGGAPASLARAGHYLFVGDSTRGIVRRIDVRSGKKVGRPIRISPPAHGAPSFAVAPAGNSVWVSSFASSTVARVSAASTTSAPRAVIASSGRAAAAQARPISPGGKVVARIRLGRGAPAPLGGGALTAGEGAVWAMSDAESTLMRIDPARNAVVSRIKARPPEAIAAGGGAVWLSYPADNAVLRIDPATNRVTARIYVGPQPAGIVVAKGAVWVADAGGPSVSRIDAASNRVVATIRLGPKHACCAEHMSLAAVGGSLWVAVPNANRLVRVDATSNSVVASVKLPYCPGAFLVAGEGAVWSAGGICADVVGRIDARTKNLTAKVAEPHAVGLALSRGRVWVAVIDSANVDQLDPRTGRLVGRLHVGGTPVRLAAAFGSVWVNDDNGRVLRIQPQR
jgi:YVTN family beta-propeller protein